MVHYEKLLDDIQSVSRMKFSNIDDMKVLCDFIRKAILSNATTIEQHCAKY
jgi:deoxyxylulose-5-phosphate synthase